MKKCNALCSYPSLTSIPSGEVFLCTFGCSSSECIQKALSDTQWCLSLIPFVAKHAGAYGFQQDFDQY